MSNVAGYANSSRRDDWDAHWDEYSDCAQNNPAVQYRRRLIFSLLCMAGSGEGVRLLDVGSGQGGMAAAVRQRFPAAQVLGLELSHSGVEISRQKVPGAQFVQCNLLDDSKPAVDQQGWATHAICSEVIEHVDDPRRLLINARHYMKEGCKLAVTAPGGPMSAFDKHIGHRKHYRAQEIGDLLQSAGYEPERLSRAGFPFFNLFRSLVILRGKKIVEDAKARKNGPASMPARAAMALFRPLLHLNLDSSPWGWQMAATALVRSPGKTEGGSTATGLPTGG